jgi:hypothetical protein
LQPNLYATTRTAGDITSLAINQELQESRSLGKKALKNSERTSRKYKLIKRRDWGKHKQTSRRGTDKGKAKNAGNSTGHNKG